jgi:uncharacterized protein (TIGR02597 family)
MKYRITTLTLGIATGLPLLLLISADGETTQPVGFRSTAALANSDTLISVPLTRPAEFAGTVQSAANNVITVAGTPGWTPSQFVYAAGSQPKTYFVLIGSGGSSNPKEGHTYTITSNGSNTLTVDTTLESVNGITANTAVIIIPYWTLATIFPESKMGVYFTATTSTSAYKTQILVPDNEGNGTNLPVTTYFFSNNVNGSTGNVGWRIVGDNFADHGDDPLFTDSYFIVRNLNQAPTVTFRGFGRVLTTKLATPLGTLVTGYQDNAVSMVRPIGVTLNQTGLGPSDGSFVGTTQANKLKDQLMLFNNAQVRHNKRASAIYYYFTGTGGPAWRIVNGGTTDHGNDIIPPGSAILLRKFKTRTGATVFWTNPPTY